MAITPINSRDVALQQLSQRLIPLGTNFISLSSPYLDFVYGSDDKPLPAKISINAQLAGVLQGTVTFVATGLKPDTALVLDSNNSNILILDPETIDGYSVTIIASLIYGGVTYSSNPIVITKRYSSLVARITRTFDNVNSAIDGTGYSLPTSSNTLELYKGAGKKITKDVTYGIQGSLLDNVVIDGLKLTIDKTTGAITLTDAQIKDGWTSDTVTFNLVTTFSLTDYPISYTITKIRQGSTAKDPTPPPTPTNVTLTSGFSYIFVELDPKTLKYKEGQGHLKTQIYAIQVDPNAGKNGVPEQIFRFNVAKFVGEFTGTVSSFNAVTGTEYRIWLVYVSIDGYSTTDPYGGTQGISKTTNTDVTKIVAAMTGTGKPFSVLTQDLVTKDNVTYKAGIYATQAFISDGQIGNASITDAAIDNAKIANISADKLSVGTGIIGGDLKSSNYTGPSTSDRDYVAPNTLPGWIIRKDGSAEFDSTSIKGTLTANQIDGTGLSIRRLNADGTYTLILDAGKPIQEQIIKYAPNATAGTTLNCDPTCSVTTIWDPRNIATITDGYNGNSVLAGSNGEWLVEGITTDKDKVYSFAYDPQRRYQISALIRRTGTASLGNVHIGLLEFDFNGEPKYEWGGYLQGIIPTANLTTNFKRYYVSFKPGDLNPGTAKVALHVILGYPRTGGGRVEIQDIRVEDITLAWNIQYAAVSTSAMDTIDKINTATTNINGTITNNTATIYANTISSKAKNIMDDGFYLQTNGFADSVGADGVITAGSGVLLSNGGIVGKFKGVPTFYIDNKGNATFKGTLELNNLQNSRTVITNDGVEVWNSGIKRVVLGKLN